MRQAAKEEDYALLRPVFVRGHRLPAHARTGAESEGGLRRGHEWLESKWRRRDRRNLTQEWLTDKEWISPRRLLTNRTDLHSVDLDLDEQLIGEIEDRTRDVSGLFNANHMGYMDEKASTEPALAEMMTKAIQALQREPKRFLLAVEGELSVDWAVDSVEGGLIDPPCTPMRRIGRRRRRGRCIWQLWSDEIRRSERHAHPGHNRSLAFTGFHRLCEVERAGQWCVERKIGLIFQVPT